MNHSSLICKESDTGHGRTTVLGEDLTTYVFQKCSGVCLAIIEVAANETDKLPRAVHDDTLKVLQCGVGFLSSLHQSVSIYRAFIVLKLSG